MLSVNQQNFKKEVLESSLPVLVHFTTPWCGLCRAIEPALIDLQDRWGGDVKLVAINPDQNFTLAKTYNLTTLPTLILFSEGRVLKRLEGFGRREDLIQQLQGISWLGARGLLLKT